MFHLVPFGWFLDDQNITSIGLFYKNRGFFLEGCLTVKNYWGLLTGHHCASIVIFPGKRNLRVCIVDGLVKSSKDYSL